MKQRIFLLKIGVCLVALSFVLYRHIDEQNKITALKIVLPQAMKELKTLKEETMNLRYRIEQFESPENLLALSKKNEFSHLQYPLAKELIAMNEGPRLIEDEETLAHGRSKSSISFASISSKK
jgi:hypothetical protein